jgi:hypothetical protein
MPDVPAVIGCRHNLFALPAWRHASIYQVGSV